MKNLIYDYPESSIMNQVKARSTITLLHLFAATLLAPFFILVAITGGLYVSDIKPETKETELKLNTPITLDADSPTLDDDVKKILSDNDIDLKFEYLRNRGSSITTRPTSRDYIVFKQDDDSWSATLNEPNFHYSMMELHKGHGPTLFKKYQIVAGIALFMIMMSGLFIGFISKAYRMKTIISTAIGTAIFMILAFLV